MSDGGKGSKPRPYSVDLNTFDNNWDRIFKQPNMNKITDKVVEQVHDNIRDKELEEYQKQAQELWFAGGSCTGGKPE